MSETGGLDIGMPDEGTGGASETVREQASQSFAASQQAAQQQIREEKKAKKRDDNVANVIIEFLTDTQKTHLATLIARLVALDCPSTFVLAILSLINDRCRTAVEDYLRERQVDVPTESTVDHGLIPAESALSDAANEQLAQWIMRMQLLMAIDEEPILRSLLIDDQNIDGTILQISAFVLQEFLHGHGKNVPFENLQQLSIGILQSLFAPAMQRRMENRIETTSEDDE